MNSEKSPNSIFNRFKYTGALLEGHFVLSSGLHSSIYLQCALALQHPGDAVMYGEAVAANFTGDAIQTVASPAIGGLVIGFATAQALGVRFIWTERESGSMTLRRGFTVTPSERILVVEDVITTGGSTRECIAALERQEATVVAAASIIDRSKGLANVSVPLASLVSLDFPSYAADSCPLCTQGIPTNKPGSRSSK